MKSAMNLKAKTNYSELFDEGSSLKQFHPALQRMQELSDQAAASAPTAITRLEVYKECHRLADDLYRLTGSKKVMIHVLRIGDLLLSRILGNQAQSLQVNQ
jgi:hypothetical protein